MHTRCGVADPNDAAAQLKRSLSQQHLEEEEAEKKREQEFRRQLSDSQPRRLSRTSVRGLAALIRIDTAAAANPPVCSTA